MDIKIFEWVVERISDMGADAVIFSDPGTFNVIRKHLPDMRLHLSTQANMLNHEAVQFRYDLWVSRVVLARELTLKEITQIKTKVPDVELEVFVHGAMCIAYSGRCLMGEYFSGRDGNKGECSHVCRYNFKVQLQEERRWDKTFDLGQDENGTYLMSSKDLCTIENLSEMMEVIDGFKIEGRSKSEMYVGAVTKAYRHLTDAIVQGTAIDEQTKNLVYQIPHRSYRNGFLFNNIRSAPDGEVEPSLQTPLPNAPRASSLGEGLPVITGVDNKIDYALNEHWWVGDDVSNQGVSKESPWPIAEVEYVGLVHPESKEIDEEIYHLFTPKQKIYVGDSLQYFDEKNIGELQITWLSIKWVAGKDEFIHVNHGDIWIHTDIDLQWREILYRPATDPKAKGPTREIAQKGCCGNG